MIKGGARKHLADKRRLCSHLVTTDEKLLVNVCAGEGVCGVSVWVTVWVSCIMCVCV